MINGLFPLFVNTNSLLHQSCEQQYYQWFRLQKHSCSIYLRIILAFTGFNFFVVLVRSVIPGN
jgi:hypothetical protein